jgi:DNA-binding NarL/FixJ family response regulator
MQPGGLSFTLRDMNILIADAQPRVRFALRLLLEQQPGWSVTGEAEDVHALLQQIQCGCPDLVLLDWELPGAPAEALLTVIRQACPRLWIVFMSGKVELRPAALQTGADVFAYKADPPEKLLGLIRELAVSKMEHPLVQNHPLPNDKT